VGVFADEVLVEEADGLFGGGGEMAALISSPMTAVKVLPVSVSISRTAMPGAA